MYNPYLTAYIAYEYDYLGWITENQQLQQVMLKIAFSLIFQY